MPLEDIRKARIEKLNKLRSAGVDPYPAKSWRTHRIGDALADFETLSSDRKITVLTGRVMALREHGGSTFANLDDGSGRIQVYFKKDTLGDHNYTLLLETVDIGDFLEVSGPLFLTKKNEKTLEVEKYRILTKSILPLPEKWHGLKDIEERFRKRYLDLIFNPEVRDKLLTRFQVIQLIRKFLQDNEFIEVETPVLQPIPGGATARPFKTHMNDLDLDLYLRVAPELYLKRLIVGGMERVFEIGKNFRNEGMDHEHNPEFTMLEFYAAYKDYEWLMELTERLFEMLALELFGRTEFQYNGNTISFKRPFKRVEFKEIIREYGGIEYDHADEGDFKKKAEELGIEVNRAMIKDNLADEIFKKVARPKMIDPIFVINHPIGLSPLSKRLTANSDEVARFQLLAGGFELINAYSELNDPIDQLERFKAQEEMRKAGNEEAQRLDQDFVDALEYGMPPTAGYGLGIDRLVMLLTDAKSLREVLPFPTMKPKD